MRLYTKIILISLSIIAAIIVLPTGAENWLIKSRLDSFFASIESATSQSKNQVSVSYESVKVSGFYPHKRAEILHPRMEVVSGNRRAIYTMDNIYVKMTSPLLESFQIEIAGEVAISQNLEKVATLRFDTPITMDVAAVQFGSKNIKGEIVLPAKIVIAQNFQPTKPAIIQFSEVPIMVTQTNDEGKLTYLRASAKNMVAQGPVVADRYTLGELNTVYQYTSNPDAKPMQDIEIVVKDLTVPDYIHPYGAGTFILRASLLGEFTPTSDIGLQLFTRSGDLELMEASYNAKDFGLNLKGKMNTRLAAMPEGNGSLVVRNVPFVLNEIIENNMLSADRRALLYTMVSKMTGESVSDLYDTNIPIERKEDSDLIIGGLSMTSIQKAFKNNDPGELRHH